MRQRVIPRRSVLLATLIVASCFACQKRGARFKSAYKMHVTVGPTTYWGMGATRFAELVAEKTSGQIKVKPYFASELVKGAQLDVARLVAMGSVDLALDSTINLSPMIPEMNVFSLPFHVQTYENVDKMEAGKTGQILFNAMASKGLRGLGWGENGFRWLTNSRGPVSRPEDLAGLRIRVVGSPIFIDIFRSLGADPLNMNWGDAVTAFQQGTVDGQENPAEILLSVQIDQYHRYLTAWGYVVDPLILYWNQKEFDAFPPEIQRGIREAADEATRFQKALARAGLDGQTSLAKLKEEFGTAPDPADPLAHFEAKGLTVTRLGPEQVAAFQAATQEIFDRWAEKIGQPVFAASQEDMQ